MQLVQWPLVNDLHQHARWRPDWTNDRPRLLWYLTFRDHPGLAEWCREAQTALRDVPTVDVIPSQWLHMTLDDVGYLDELPEKKLDELSAAMPAVLEQWHPPPLTLGPLTTMEDAVVLRTEPYAELRELRDRVRTTTERVIGRPVGDESDSFLPHVSLAYVNEVCDRPGVMGPLEQRSDVEVLVESAELTLAEVTRHDRHYEWLVRAALPLSAATRRAWSSTP